MARHKMTKGVCRLCSKDTDLSFEHVPPKVTNNKNTKYITLPLEEYYKTDNILDATLKGKKKQGGIGYNSFCRKCNSFLGTNYVPSYEKWVQAGYQLQTNSETAYIKYQITKIEPLKILKHIISMFLAINDNWYLESYPELAEFVSDVNSTTLPKNFRVFTYLNKDGNIRYIQHQTVGDFSSGHIINCSEITFPPYGYVLILDYSNQNIEKLTDITEFKNIGNNENLSINIEIHQLPTHINIPLDYRTKEEIKIAIEKGSKKRNEEL
ncbi:hypothetical protein QVZ41_13955 [Wenyingzhuangia sp. chi5]|uniref:HNH endonuclease n=1 Tax=Wenyingzhuangia gilva TaxID=3057677 RepID=A0ABT8VVG1_9FLAO|nr:hypothetical protein [Wenyingzhuangia sp. chi5]MDO3695951.1 hypothetical protein [Wenyingzhuangia sp. chi5]